MTQPPPIATERGRCVDCEMPILVGATIRIVDGGFIHNVCPWERNTSTYIERTSDAAGSVADTHRPV